MTLFLRLYLCSAFLVWCAGTTFELWSSGKPIPWWWLPLIWALPFVVVPPWIWLGEKVGMIPDALSQGPVESAVQSDEQAH